MILRNGMRIRRPFTVTQYGGARGYLFWIADCFDPIVWFVRGDSFEDAYANFLDDERVAERLKVEAPTDYGYPSWEALGEAWARCEVSAVDYNESGVFVDTDHVNGCDFSSLPSYEMEA